MKKSMILVVLTFILLLVGCDMINTELKKTNKITTEETTVKKIDEYKFTERTIISDKQRIDGTIDFSDSLWQTPDYEYDDTLTSYATSYKGVKGLFYTSIEYKGKPTKVAAYIGFPEGASATNKCPAIVLVHGGLGTAFPDWVKYWNDLGFAAIAMDTEGAEPTSGINCNTGSHNQENRFKNDETYTNGPTNNSFGTRKLEDSWYYHAVCSVIVGTSLLTSFDCVDTQRVGMTGISWGSMIASVVVQYDDRISFCMPIYGGVSLVDSCSGFATIYGTSQMAELWDSLEGLKTTNCKMFYATSLNDQAFSFDAASRCAEASKGFTLFKKVFNHGQADGAFEPNLPFFAKYFCGMESEFVEVLQHPTKDDPTLKLRTYGGVSINSIKIFYTDAAKPNRAAEWENKNVKLVNGLYEYTLNIPECSYFFVQIKYNNNLEVTTYLEK